MNPIAFFVFQFLWFTLVWALIASYVVWPWSKSLSLHQRLSLWVVPEMFRVLGVGLLVPNLSPDMPLSFALPTAVADTATSLLAVLAFIALQRSWRAARLLVWLCTIVGVSDLLVAFPHAATTGAIAHLATQWYVPVFAGPVMVVAHAACIATLLESRRAGLGGRSRAAQQGVEPDAELRGSDEVCTVLASTFLRLGGVRRRLSMPVDAESLGGRIRRNA